MADRHFDEGRRDRRVRRRPAFDGPRLRLSHQVFFELVRRRPRVCRLRMEPEQFARSRKFSAALHQRRHIRHDRAVDVRRNVLFVFLLAQRRSLELLHQLPSLGRAQDLVRCAGQQRRAAGDHHEEHNARTVPNAAGPLASTGHYFEPQRSIRSRGAHIPNGSERRRVRRHVSPIVSRRLQPRIQFCRSGQLRAPRLDPDRSRVRLALQKPEKILRLLTRRAHLQNGFGREQTRTLHSDSDVQGIVFDGDAGSEAARHDLQQWCEEEFEEAIRIVVRRRTTVRSVQNDLFLVGRLL